MSGASEMAVQERTPVLIGSRMPSRVARVDFHPHLSIFRRLATLPLHEE